jgi:hypothetical protein
MSKKPPRSPREKKALSYAKDRRNDYGENDKAARTAIPLRKAMENRQVRRKTAQAMGALPLLSEEAVDLLESSARHDINRVGGWRKSADAPLGEHIAKALAAREARIGRKMRSAKATSLTAAQDPDTLARLASRYRRIARWLTRRYPGAIALARQYDTEAERIEQQLAQI